MNFLLTIFIFLLAVISSNGNQTQTDYPDSGNDTRPQPKHSGGRLFTEYNIPLDKLETHKVLEKILFTAHPDSEILYSPPSGMKGQRFKTTIGNLVAVMKKQGDCMAAYFMCDNCKYPAKDTSAIEAQMNNE